MFRPDCIWVWIFSTTSPSWMRSCVTLMPVISVKALASVFDSYSCVVMVSETTLISMPGEGLGGIDEPLHLLHLVVLRERRGLELAVDPAPRLVHAGKRRAGRAAAPRRSRWSRSDSSRALQVVLIVYLPLASGRTFRSRAFLRPFRPEEFGALSRLHASGTPQAA